MNRGRHDAPVGGGVAPQLVRHQLPWLAPLLLQKLAKEPFGYTGVAVSLNQDIDQVPVLIDGPPQIVSISSDPHEDLIQVPNVTQSILVEPESPSVLGAELPTPLPDGLVGDDDYPLREKLLNVAKTQGEPVVQPDAVTDDFARKPETFISLRMRFHPRILAGQGLS